MSSQNLKYTTKLVGKRVLILGGTSGIGFAVAEAAVEHGADVIVSSSNADKVTKALQRLRDAYPTLTSSQRLSGSRCDLSNSAELETNLKRLLDEVTDGGNLKLNHVVYTAGNAIKLPALEEITVDDVHATNTVRHLAPLMLAKLLPKYMERSPENSFTMTGGAVGQRPPAGWSAVAATASASEGLTRGLAQDLKPLRVNIVSPGAVHTELFNSFGENVEAVLDSFRKNTLTGTVGRPEDLAESYIYIMKDRFITGTVIASNGGMFLA